MRSAASKNSIALALPLLCLVAGSLGLTGACASTSELATPPRVDPAIQARAGDAALQAAYEAALDRWTRRATLYDRLDARFFFAATLLAPDFLRALEARDAGLGLSPLRLIIAPPDGLPASAPPSPPAPAMLLGLYAHDPKLDDFAERQSIWKITLTTPQGTLTPKEIRRISRPDLRLRSSFPALDRFWVAYLVTFEGGSARPIAWDEAIVELKSILGHVSLNFEPVTARH
ncbi:MAG: hypothetical protein LBM75_08115 [Myxococcales bacterium]|jgi:hypothetical protein|nr:hypothetical protein [Myxococcales bacterium]